MIPKKAHFYWHNEAPMPRLRQLCIESFRAFNPDWEVFVHHPADTSKTGFRDIVLQSDAARYGILARAGGVYFDTDIAFIKPIPESWLDTDVLIPANGPGAIFGVHVLGGTPGSPFWIHACQRVKERMAQPTIMGCQALGVKLWQDNVFEVAARYGLLVKGVPFPAFLINAFDVEYLWSPGEIPVETVGVHWYGGDRLSLEFQDYDLEALPDCIVKDAYRLALKRAENGSSDRHAATL